MSTTQQVVNEEKQFADDVEQFAKQTGLVGFDYAVVAVFGSQSTGKSTLLNALFACEFDTMNEADRKQTTRGIWLAKAESMNVLVMDVEGTDGRERGEDQDFERKAALFALATSQILIINLWEHQVGLYQGANLGLLKTVFEVNLQLFAKTQSRSLLLFVIRDFVGTTPLQNLETTLKTDLETIWASITKPPGYEGCAMTDYFDIQFVGLAHKLLMPVEFDVSVDVLRKRFASQEFFKPEYHRRIPVDGFPRYAKGIWEQIMSNKDLDLPTQQELLAQFRCDEIARAAGEVFDAAIVPLEANMGTGKIMDELGSIMAEQRSLALKSFDEDASRYHRQVYITKRKDFVDKLDSRLHTLYVAQLSALHKACMADFEESVIKGVKTPAYDFGQLVALARKAAEDKFQRVSRACLIEEAGWSFQDDFSNLQLDLSACASRLRAHEMTRVVSRIDKKLKNDIDGPVSLVFKNISSNLWDRVLDLFTEVLNSAEQIFREKSRSLNSSDKETDSGLIMLRKRAWKTLHAKIEEEVMDANMHLRLRDEFEDKFRYDDAGIPRVWRPHDDIDGVYRAAREHTLNLLPLFSKIQREDGSVPNLTFLECSDQDDDEDELDEKRLLSVIEPARQHELAARFRKTADAIFLDAKRSTVSSVAKVPFYFYALLLALGWNEIVAVLRNPLYFMMMLLLIVLAYVFYQLNLWSPMIQLSDGLVRQALDLGKQRLREALQESTGPVPNRQENRREPPKEVEMKEVGMNGDHESSLHGMM